MKLSEELMNLHEQATKERSHYYVKDLAKRAADEIDRLEKRIALDNGELAFQRGLEIKRLEEEVAALNRKLEGGE